MMLAAFRGAVSVAAVGFAVSACSGPHSRPAASKVTTSSAPPAQVSAPPTSTTATTSGQPTVSSPAATAPVLTNMPVVDDCTGAPHTRPAQIILACADGTLVADDIGWSSWTATQATGSATMVVNDCTPNCAYGHDHSYPASMVRGRVQVRGGRPVYTVATVTYTAATPPGQSRSDDYSIAPIG